MKIETRLDKLENASGLKKRSRPFPVIEYGPGDDIDKLVDEFIKNGGREYILLPKKKPHDPAS